LKEDERDEEVRKEKTYTSESELANLEASEYWQEYPELE